MGFIAKCICFIFNFLLIGAIIALIVWTSDYPINPQFSINRASISQYNLTSDNQITATVNLLITAINPNPDYFIYYDVILVSIYNKSTLLSYKVTLETLVHHPNTKLRLKSSPMTGDMLFADGFTVPNTTFGTNDPNVARIAGLEVRIRMNARFEHKGWKKVNHAIKATCYPVYVKFTSFSQDRGILQNTNCIVFVF